ncbi:MAG: clostripain-related cysteine peptidase [Bacteroidales bacterium]|nr:clostripain-related cysteine peptidase [Bacteroidales bacterium]
MKGRTVILWLLAVLVTGCLVSCSKDAPQPEGTYQKVLLLYSAGYNNLSSSLAQDIKEMCQDAPTRFLSRAYKVIVFSHLKYGRCTDPVLLDVTTVNGKIVYDTLAVYSSKSSASAETFGLVLQTVKDKFPAREYGIIMTSHANGWLPAGYFLNPEEKEEGILWAPRMANNDNVGSQGYGDTFYTVDNPEVKALCFQDLPEGGGLEMELVDFAGAIRDNGMHFKYIVFDMCLMGGIEVAYELRDVVDYIAFSPTEVLSDGFAYKTILQRLLYSQPSDVVGVCTDYFEQYRKSGRSATISAIDCVHLDDLATVCTGLFEKYRDAIATLNQKSGIESGGVQYYCDLQSRRFFFDLKDALAKAGASTSELSLLDVALRNCVMYHAETEKFNVSGENFKLKNCCGLSMYLPSSKRPVLNDSYEELAWNKATSLVK